MKSWKGEDSTHVYNMKNHDEDKKEKYQDEWDEEYDAGKVKKNKSRRPYEDEEDRYKKKNNEFQKLQDFRNQTKVTSKVIIQACVTHFKCFDVDFKLFQIDIPPLYPLKTSKPLVSKH